MEKLSEIEKSNKDFLERHDITCTKLDDGWELESYIDGGGDQMVYVCNLTRDELVEYLQDYDVNEETNLWFPEGRPGKGVPFDNYKDLWDDIENWRQWMLGSDDTMCVAYCSTLNDNEKLEDFELLLTYGDACYASHGGDCFNDVQELRQVDYVREQLNKLSDAQLKAYVEYYFGYEKDDIKGRAELELYSVWLAAGDIIDNAYCGEDVRAA